MKWALYGEWRVCVCAAFTRQVWRSVCDVLGSDVWVTRDIFSLSLFLVVISCRIILWMISGRCYFQSPESCYSNDLAGPAITLSFPRGTTDRSRDFLIGHSCNLHQIFWIKKQNYKTTKHKKEIQSNDALDSNAEKADFYWQKRNKTGGYASALHVRIFSRKSFNQTRREREIVRLRNIIQHRQLASERANN